MLYFKRTSCSTALYTRSPGCFVKRSLLALAAVLFSAAFAFAQEDGSRLEKRYEKPPEPKSSLQPLQFPIDEKAPPAVAGTIRFVLRELKISGNTALSTDELAPSFQALLGKEVSLLDIYKARDTITAQYGAAGFALCKAVIPEQRIQSGGAVVMEIIEGYVDEVVIEGGSTAQRDYLEYAARQIKAERPLRAKTLERYLLLTNDRFAVKTTSVMKPSEKNHGATTLILQVEDAKLLEGNVSIDNRGTKTVGPTQINNSLGLNGLFGRASQTALAYNTVDQAEELQYFSLSHTEILTNEGTALNLSYSSSESRPGTKVMHDVENKSYTETWTIKLSHPFIRTRQQNLSLSAKYDQKDTNTHQLTSNTVLDKIRSVRLGANYDYSDGYQGINQALLEYSHGILGLGSSSNRNDIKSRADGKYDYSKATLNLSRTQELGILSPALAKFSLFVSAGGQLSETGLLSSEEFGVGGQQYGRAYDSSEIIGDNGWAYIAEMRYTADTSGTWLKYLQLYGYFDQGQIYNYKPTSSTDTHTKGLSSAGAGLRYGITDHLSGSLEYALPLSRIVNSEHNGNGRLFASISARF